MSCLLLATESVTAHLDFFTSLQYQSVGVMIVLTSLGGLAIIVTAVGKVLEPRMAAAKPAAVVSTPAASSAISPEVRAAIAAAVHVVARGPHRILEVTQTIDPRLSAWSIEGRRQIFHSHNVR